jgi:hypothetical protein
MRQKLTRLQNSRQRITGCARLKIIACTPSAGARPAAGSKAFSSSLIPKMGHLSHYGNKNKPAAWFLCLLRDGKGRPGKEDAAPHAYLAGIGVKIAA